MLDVGFFSARSGENKGRNWLLRAPFCDVNNKRSAIQVDN